MANEVEFRNLNQAGNLAEVTENTKVVVLENGVTKQTPASNLIKPDELPEVTDADEGKVLTVNSQGEWDAETPSTPSGSGELTVNFTIGLNPETEQIVITEVTPSFEDVLSAFLEGKKITGMATIPNEGYTSFTMTRYYSDDPSDPSGSYFQFNNLEVFPSYGDNAEIIYSSESCEFTLYEGKFLPSPDTAGRVLTVAGNPGDLYWESANIPSNDFVVTYTENSGTYTATHDGEPVTFAEISEAIEAGKNVRATDGSDIIFSISNYGANNTVWFSACTIESGKICVYQITHDSSDSIVATNEAVTPDAD